VGLKVKIYGIWMVGYIGITVTSPREPWVMLHVTSTYQSDRNVVSRLRPLVEFNEYLI
jgi:hypothetical protein